MTESRLGDDLLVRYLLGDPLSDADQAEIEERYFVDDVYFEHMMGIEDDLIDNHLKGTLPETSRAAFEQHFLASARRREKWESQQAIVSFFRSDRQQARAHSPSVARGFRSAPRAIRARGFRQWGLLAIPGLVFALLAAGYLGWRSARFYDGGSRSRSDLASATVHENPGPPPLATFVLRPLRLRSGAGNDFAVSPGTRWVVLSVELPHAAESYSSFDSVLSTADGAQICLQQGLARTGPKVEVDLPASMLPQGDYVLSVNGRTNSGPVPFPGYQFRISR